MKLKILLLLLFISSLFGYLEWGGDNHSFLFQAEFDIFKKLIQDPAGIAHPFTILPILGQILLVIAVLQRRASRTLIYMGIGNIGILVVFMFFIGIISLNMKIVGSVLPFVITAVMTIVHLRSYRSVSDNNSGT